MPSASRDRPPAGRGLRRRHLLGTAAALLVPGGPLRAAPEEDPTAFVQAFGDAAVAILRDGGRDDAAKVAALGDLLARSVDLDLIARTVAGRHWRAMDEAQRSEYGRLFRELVTRAMTERLHRYTGQTFKVVRTRAAPGGDSLVSTAVANPSSGRVVNLDWRVRAEGARTGVIDVVVEGVSLVVTQRAEADAIVQNRGVDGLLAEMRARAGAAPGAPRRG